ncbi:NUDIX domain-containing protein [Candidatus Uhrbacteria bacterium]|nr:NUDIX domain-containing protein [Candidatus Uhrbacteria bacterium]
MFKRERGAVYFAMVVDSYGKWAFPKGHVRDGETYRQAAVREIGEEMGLKILRYIARLDTIDIWFRDRYVHKGELIHKYIHYFLFEAPPGAQLVKPPIEDEGERIQSVAWVHASELAKRSSYPDMVAIIEPERRGRGGLGRVRTELPLPGPPRHRSQPQSPKRKEGKGGPRKGQGEESGKGGPRARGED